jgi:hypothetical protein
MDRKLHFTLLCVLKRDLKILRDVTYIVQRMNSGEPDDGFSNPTLSVVCEFCNESMKYNLQK